MVRVAGALPQGAPAGAGAGAGPWAGSGALPQQGAAAWAAALAAIRARLASRPRITWLYIGHFSVEFARPGHPPDRISARVGSSTDRCLHTQYARGGGCGQMSQAERLRKW